MRIPLALVAALWLAPLVAIAGKPPMIKQVRQHVVEARTLYARHQAGAKGGFHAQMRGKLEIIKNQLEAVVKNKGTALPNAKRLVAEAIDQAQAAKSDPEKLDDLGPTLAALQEQVQKAVEAIER